MKEENKSDMCIDEEKNATDPDVNDTGKRKHIVLMYQDVMKKNATDPDPRNETATSNKIRSCCGGGGSTSSSSGGGGGGGGGIGDWVSLSPDQVLEIVLENVLVFLTSRHDRNSASLVCKSWYRAEALTRSELFVGNCYAVSPHRVIQRFRGIRSLCLKGKPRFADFGLVPLNWGAHFTPWVAVMSVAYPCLEKICLKRMLISDEDLVLVSSSLPEFKELLLICCEGFGLSGLACVAENCRQLRVLDLIECEVKDDDDYVDWVSYFPETQTSLESLIFDCIEAPVNFDALEKLVVRSPSLRKLKLNRYVSLEQLHRLMRRAPQLTHLGTGSFNSTGANGTDAVVQEEQEEYEEQEVDLASAFAASKHLTCLSGFKDIAPDHLLAIHPVCANLTSLNFSYANINTEQFKSVICHCHKLQVLWALDSVADEGLQAVAAACKDLRELRVFPLNLRDDSDCPVSEVGLRAISEGCRKLRSILYFCKRMTNAAVVAMSNNCPDLVVFRLCIMGIHEPDHLTGRPMDEGFGAIVMNCKKLTRLAVSGLLTDEAFRYIGQHGKLVRTLSFAFAGNSDVGLTYVLQGCPKLQKLEIRDSPFGDEALLSGLHHYYNMRFLWMSSCKPTLGCCKELARRMPHLVVEVIHDENAPSEFLEKFRRDEMDLSYQVDKLYLYRSLEGPRNEAPEFVSIM